MLGKADIVWFVATTRPERARAFYEETLGLSKVTEDDFAIVFQANGVMLRIQTGTRFHCRGSADLARRRRNRSGSVPVPG